METWRQVLNMCGVENLIHQLWFSSHAHPVSSTFHSFVDKLVSTMALSAPTVILAMQYIHLLKTTHPASVPEPGSEFGVTVAAFLAAHKYLEDHTYPNNVWAKVVGITTMEMNELERRFLEGVEWNLKVDENIWETWMRWIGEWKESADPEDVDMV